VIAAGKGKKATNRAFDLGPAIGCCLAVSFDWPVPYFSRDFGSTKGGLVIVAGFEPNDFDYAWPVLTDRLHMRRGRYE
jgi:hypothetical protein